jgi:hypothetical protein
MKLVIGFVMSCLFFANIPVSQAEPSSAVQYLMNTPVSMLAFGIHNLETNLESIFRENGYQGIIGVRYDANENKIVITLIPKVKFASDKSIDALQFEPLTTILGEEQAKDQLVKFIGYTREKLGVEKETGKPILQDGRSMLWRHFSYPGYESKSEPTNLPNELDKITEIRVALMVKKGIGFTSISAKGPLLGNLSE